jgi:starch synthase
MKPIKVLFVAAEAEPFVKIGGLGDVAGSLPQALHALGDVDIRLVIPFHGAIQRQAYSFEPLATFYIPHRNGPIRADALATEVNGLPVYLISGDLISPDAPVYSRIAGVDANKFTFFSFAVLELMHAINWFPDVLHANDWHTAITIYALSHQKDGNYPNIATLLGIHNLPYLGESSGPTLEAFGLPPFENSSLPGWAKDLPLALGILSADHIVAVSPTYAQEILTKEFGSGLEDVLKQRAGSITGILNGINTEMWDPEGDSNLVKNYSPENVSSRRLNKEILLSDFKLNPDPEIPLLALVSRLYPQKGVDLIPEALKEIADKPWQFILLGTGDPDLEVALSRLEAEYPDKIRAAIRYDAVLSHRIYAGADALLIPSRYEPCGLTQIIAMRYGCVPIARKTGGLHDTIMDYDETLTSTGFLFDDATPQELAKAIKRALIVYADRQIWEGLQQQGMSLDFSWERSARKYLELYRSIALTQSERRNKTSQTDDTKGSDSSRGIPWRKNFNNSELSKKK